MCLSYKRKEQSKIAVTKYKTSENTQGFELTSAHFNSFEVSHLHMWSLLVFFNIIWCYVLFLCIPLSSVTSTQNDVISKLCTCAISLAIYLSLCKLLPVERAIDDDFINSTPFYLQVIYLYLAMLTLRPKYYFVWTFGELLITAIFSLYVAQYEKSVNNELKTMLHPLEVSECLAPSMK